MALKAGYVGVKRWIYEKLQATTAKNVEDIETLSDGISDIWSNNGLTGAKNFLKPTSSGDTIFAVDSSGIATANGTASGGTDWFLYCNGALVLEPGTYLINGFTTEGGDTTFGMFYRVHGQESGTYVTKNNTKMTVASKTTYDFFIVIRQGYTATDLVFKPMIRLASDPDTTFVPYAMTNQQLTGSADEQKTAINAIITAATGAADFAAFKTAMGAITPVTRSAAPETREVIEPEPEPVTKTTRSTKKTATIKEGE